MAYRHLLAAAAAAASKDEDDELLRDLCKFFQRRQNLLARVVKYTDNGKFRLGVTKSIFKETKKVLSCPFRAIRAIVDLNIPLVRYYYYDNLLNNILINF